MANTISLKDIEPNPENPRVIKDEKFKKLVKSIKEFPEMLSKRPIVCVTNTNGKIYPLGGNMRLKALKELGYKEIPKEWILMADEWTEEQRKEFIIKDNIGYGEWDWDILANEWDADQLEEWGLDVPNFGTDEAGQEDDGEEAKYIDSNSWFINVRCDNEEHAQELYEKFINEGLDVKIIT